MPEAKGLRQEEGRAQSAPRIIRAAAPFPLPTLPLKGEGRLRSSLK